MRRYFWGAACLLACTMILTSAWSEPSRSAAPSAKLGNSKVAAVKAAPADAGMTSPTATSAPKSGQQPLLTDTTGTPDGSIASEQISDIAAAYDKMAAAI